MCRCWWLLQWKTFREDVRPESPGRPLPGRAPGTGWRDQHHPAARRSGRCPQDFRRSACLKYLGCCHQVLSLVLWWTFCVGGAREGLLFSFPPPAWFQVGERGRRAFAGSTRLPGLWLESDRVTAVVAIAAGKQNCRFTALDQTIWRRPSPREA